MKLATKSRLRSPKESMVPGDSFRNHDLAGPFRVAENALHITSSEQPWSDIRLLYESRWSIGSVFPSYIPSWAGSLNFDEIRALNILSVNGGSVCLISASTVTGAPTPVLMASSRASKSRIFCEVDLSRALAWSPLRGLLPLLNRVGVLLDSEELFSRKEELGAWRLPRPNWSALIFLERFPERFEWQDRSTSGMSGAAGTISCISRWRPSRSGAWAGSAIGWDLLPGGLLALGLDRILVEMESLEVGILSTLPRPRARRRQYFGSGRSDEYLECGSGELSGDDLARFHGLVLPRSGGFGDRVWRSTCGDGTS
ncbi:hypothetical protein Acr_13g0017070 [Actinidia rufa]|uniref:Uncharacterized protein n=1 Tax=Actinidia rufa TaxID=165716 RepID=A0A7J0FQV8_9ERIC|nr:hypothetical protein Acr_13g0017070 [Actinidia rufa]